MYEISLGSVAYGLQLFLLYIHTTYTYIIHGVYICISIYIYIDIYITFTFISVSCGGLPNLENVKPCIRKMLGKYSIDWKRFGKRNEAVLNVTNTPT